MKYRLTTEVLRRAPFWLQRLGEHLVARKGGDELPELTGGARVYDGRPRIALIAVWLGLPPSYLPAFLRSASKNPGFDWLVFADWNGLDLELPENVRLFHASRSSLVARCFRTVGFVPSLTDPNKMCDLRPLYSRIFARELEGFDYWGFCDFDCVWGDLDRAYGAPIRDGVDVVTSREQVLAGHFTVLRSGSPIEARILEDARLVADMKHPHHLGADEDRFSDVVREAARDGAIRVHWPDLIAGDEQNVDQEGNDPEPWWWRDGRVTHHGREFSYLHFMMWKHRPEFDCDLNEDDRDGPFTITPAGIRSAETATHESGDLRAGGS
jgi:hypothetical protein